MKVREIAAVLERLAPPSLAADWDNVGLLIGDGRSEVNSLMLCIDLTESVLAEAARVKARMIMAYHPVLFQPARRLTAADVPVAYSAAAGGFAVYSMHTALDVAPGGTNDVLAEVLGIRETRPIEPLVRPGGYKLAVFTPAEDLAAIADAAFGAGAGTIGSYERCSFFTHGIGTFRGLAGSRPTVGQPGRQEATEELRLEMVVPKERVAGVCAAVRGAHGYESPAIDIYPVAEAPAGIGMGRVGRLPRPVAAGTLIKRIKQRAGLKRVLFAPAGGKAGRLVSVAACAAGSCGAIYKAAIGAGATFYLTGEMRHHDALAAAAAGLDVVCLGHSNSERMTLRRLAERLRRELPKLGVALARMDRDPFEIV